MRESLNADIVNERVNEMKREMGWRIFNDVSSSNMPEGRDVRLLECKVQMEDC